MNINIKLDQVITHEQLKWLSNYCDDLDDQRVNVNLARRVDVNLTRSTSKGCIRVHSVYLDEEGNEEVSNYGLLLFPNGLIQRLNILKESNQC